jgi:hypothetical protein
MFCARYAYAAHGGTTATRLQFFPHPPLRARQIQEVPASSPEVGSDPEKRPAATHEAALANGGPRPCTTRWFRVWIVSGATENGSFNCSSTERPQHIACFTSRSASAIVRAGAGRGRAGAEESARRPAGEPDQPARRASQGRGGEPGGGERLRRQRSAHRPPTGVWRDHVPRHRHRVKYTGAYGRRGAGLGMTAPSGIYWHGQTNSPILPPEAVQRLQSGGERGASEQARRTHQEASYRARRGHPGGYRCCDRDHRSRPHRRSAVIGITWPIPEDLDDTAYPSSYH